MDQHLLVFVTVAEKQNFSHAAQELHMTQPAVSQYIKTLEDNMGTRLLERTNKYVHLNKAGKIVYYHGKEIIDLHTKMQTLVDDLAHQVTGPLSVGASYTFGEYVLPHIIADMKKDYPDIQPTITIGNTVEIAEAVKRHELDVGIVEGHFKQEQHMQVEPFAEDHMELIASSDHPLAYTKEPIAMKELEEHTWVLREEGSGTREAAETLFNQHDIAPKKMIHFSSTQPIKEAVGAGLGISLMSDWAIQREVSSGDLLPIRVDGLPFKRQFSIVTGSPFWTKALEAFIDHVKKEKTF